MPVSTLPPGQVLDLRRRDKTLEQLGAVFGELIRKGMQDPEDKARELFVKRPELGPQYAAQGYRIQEVEERLQKSIGEPTPLDEEGKPGFEGAEEMPEVAARELMLPTLPGTDEPIPEGVLQELMAMYPESREAQIEGALEEAGYGPEVEAGDILGEIETQRAERGARGAQARAGELEAGRRAGFLEAMESKEGLSVEDEVELAKLQHRYETRKTLSAMEDLDLSDRQRGIMEERMDHFENEILPNLSPGERELYTLGGIEGTQYLMQAYFQDRAYDQQVDMALMRQQLAGARSPKEALMARFANRVKVEKDVDRIMGEMRQAIENDNEEVIPAYIEQLQSRAQVLHEIDPSSVAVMADRVNGMLRKNKIKDVEFRTVGIMDTNPEIARTWADELARTDMSEEDIAEIREGVEGLVAEPEKREPMVDLIVNRAMEIKSGGTGDVEASMTAAQMAETLPPDEIDQQYEQALLEFNQSLWGGQREEPSVAESAPEVQKSFMKVTILRLAKMLQSGMEKMPSRGEVY